MICIRSATLNRIPVRLQQGLGRAWVLFACEGTYRFSGGKSASEGIHNTIAGWLIRIDLPAAGGAGQT